MSIEKITSKIVGDAEEKKKAVLAEANAKAEEIGKHIGRGGRLIPCSGGAIWLKRGSPFAQSMGDNADDMIRRKYLNITAEFITAV